MQKIVLVLGVKCISSETSVMKLVDLGFWGYFVIKIQKFTLEVGKLHKILSRNSWKKSTHHILSHCLRAIKLHLKFS